ncbi:S-adenosyl-L-methionine-dependent methyltransferase [Tricharina praecox]|uniref:S-adenosyl-L-methionine-dependent methyltransferase n=1 Tax=Tricharina praecox TaxID=43433 RepID=UPI00221F6BAB|nr:S-adenosyl-L-methionine-dependent methyltransferase [Tricharina praecox]KAI5845500.1 S-adenosyl-L-methionine-dependent methyltransferase [Tricharina praecox]
MAGISKLEKDEMTIEVDPAVLENSDADYESAGYDSSTQSLTSSINEWIFENGRRYHVYFGAEKNLMPTDEVEQDRLDMHHESLLQILSGKLHLAPLKEPHRILDVGTGTGIWAIDMADKYPSAEVIGIDLSPIQPKWVPPNCRFEVDDAEREWTYAENSFDFIHLRNISISISDWQFLLGQAYRCLKPGGYIEHCELGIQTLCDDGTMPDDHGSKRCMEYISEAMTSIGKPPATKPTMVDNMKEAGFVEIDANTFKQPIGPWPKDPRMKRIGGMSVLLSETGYEAYGMGPLTRILGFEHAKAKKICDDAFAAVKNKNYHVYNHYYVVYARKPEEE